MKTLKIIAFPILLFIVLIAYFYYNKQAPTQEVLMEDTNEIQNEAPSDIQDEGPAKDHAHSHNNENPEHSHDNKE